MIKDTSCLFIVFVLVLLFQFLFSQNTRSHELFLNGYTAVEVFNEPTSDKMEEKTVSGFEFGQKVDFSVKNKERAILKSKAVPEMSLASR